MTKLEQQIHDLKNNRPVPAPPAPHPSRLSSVRGLGDVVAATTDRLGIKKCAKCAKRQTWLNALVPNPFTGD